MRFCEKCGARLKSPSKRACPNCGASLGLATNEEVQVVSARSLVQSFPYSRMRPHQEEVLRRIESAIASRKKFIILEAPVGFGKSAVAAALCRHLRSAYVLTSTKQLQAQYSADFGFNTVMGKSNFTCYVPTSSGKHVDCGRGRCQADWSLSDCPHYLSFDQYEAHLKRLCDRESKCEKVMMRAGEGKLCTYYKQKWDSFRQHVTVGNYSFFFSELRYTDDVRKRKLLVCDEAHDLERQLVGSAEYDLKTSAVRQYRLPGTPDYVVPYEPRMEQDASAWVGPLSGARDLLRSFFESREGDPTMQDKLIACRGMLESLERLLEELNTSPQNWVVSDVRTSSGLSGTTVEEAAFQPLEVAGHTSKLFATAETVLLMSATIFSEELLCRTLGIPEAGAEFVKVAESSFPVENRRIYAMDIAELRHGASLESIAKAVDEIMDRHSGERGVVHVTSHAQANYIVAHVSEHNRERLTATEGVLDRSELLRSHGAKEGSVLISPSFHQGVDLKDDLSRFQVVVKVPYPDLSDRRIRVKMQRDAGWYDWQTALRLVQTYGRSVRSETDHAVTYVLDSKFPGFVRDHRELFPSYFLDALS